MYRGNVYDRLLDADPVGARPALIAPSTRLAARPARSAATGDTGRAVTLDEPTSIPQHRPSGTAIKSVVGEIRMHCV
jgi:hypothetical protein